MVRVRYSHEATVGFATGRVVTRAREDRNRKIYILAIIRMRNIATIFQKVIICFINAMSQNRDILNLLAVILRIDIRELLDIFIPIPAAAIQQSPVQT